MNSEILKQELYKSVEKNTPDYIKNNKYVNPRLKKMIDFYERKLVDGR